MEATAARSGRGLWEGLYRVLMRRNSVYVTFVVAGAFVGERLRGLFPETDGCDCGESIGRRRKVATSRPTGETPPLTGEGGGRPLRRSPPSGKVSIDHQPPTRHRPGA
ncbi:hypothetical protein KSP40_PGU015349 [Platanthera guangdongensis]|uniref:Uncharacterized protein n=1 Tax=Platanthera guangdongensis TaxID=2320717 RepID=A0ABR2N4Z2_9ASPA